MSDSGQQPPSLDERLLEQPRRTAGIDAHRRPVGLGERDSDGYLVGYIDDCGLAWESLAEWIVARHGGALFDALMLEPDDTLRERLIEQVLAVVPDELIG